MIKIIGLYSVKYVEDFREYLLPFFNLIWGQVDSLSTESTYYKVRD